MNLIGKRVGEVGHGDALEVERLSDPPCTPVALARCFGLGNCELWAAVRDDKFIDRHGFGFEVRLEVEAIGEQRDEHDC